MGEEITFGQVVKTRRKELGLTQKELAHRARCATVTLRKIEYNDLRPSVLIAEGLATALNILLEKRAAFVYMARAERGIAKDFFERYESIETLLADFRHSIGIDGRVTPPENTSHITPSIVTLTDADNPYKGLRAFEESDEADFFGREALIQRLLARLQEGGDLARFLAVAGPSGSGKSSVIKAGLIPALKRGALPSSENWIIIKLIPGSNPLEELEVAFQQLAGNLPLSLIDELQKDTFGLLRAVNHSLPDDPTVELLLVIDQFEELFTLVQDEALRVHLLHNLINAALDERSRVHIVLTLRADFLDRSLNYVDFSELISQRIEFVLPLMQDELERVILGPAERVGLRIDAGVVSAIIRDLGDQPGTLPLLQYALTELFDKREGNTVTKTVYQSIDGVLGALGRRADDVFTGLDKVSQNTARQLFLRLVTLGEGVEDTRRRVLRSEIEAITEQENKENLRGPKEKEVDLVLDAFGKARLLTFDRDPLTRGPTVEIAHEALIRAWSRLQDWLAQSREDLRIQRQLTLSSKEWTNAHRDLSFLATGARLVRFEALAAESDLALNEEERAYLNASVVERQRLEAERSTQQKRLLNLQRWIISILTIFLVLAAALLVFAFNQRREALIHADIAFSRQLAAQALAEMEKPLGNDEFAALLAIRSLKVQYDPVADAALVEAAGKLPLRVFSGHSDAISSAAISPDMKYLLTGSADTTARLWELATGRKVYTLSGHTGEIASVAFSPDNKSILSGSSDATAKLWDVATGQELFTLQSPMEEVITVNFSPDGKYALISGVGGPATLWEVTTGQEVLTFPNMGPRATFSPDGKYILATGDEYTARLWEVGTGKEMLTLRGHTDWPHSIAFSPDGKYALTGSIDNTAKLWDLSTGHEIYTIRDHSSSVRSVAFSPDGKYILTGSGDRTARLWDVATGQEVRSWRSHMHRVLSVAISSDGKYVVTASQDGTAKLWDFATGEGRALRGHSAEIYGTAFSPDSKFILTSSSDLTAKLWDIGTGKEVRTFSGHDDLVRSVTFSPDAKYTLTSSEDGTAKLWEADTGKEVRTFEGHTHPVYAAAFSPNGRYVLTGSADTTAKLWETMTGAEVRAFRAHNAEVMSVTFSSNGKYVLTASADTTAKMWEMATGKILQTFTGHTDTVYGVDFSPDGQYILTGSADTTAKLWEVSTGREVRTFNGHTNTVYDVMFSPNGKYALTASADRTAKIWNVATSAEVRTLSGHTSAIWSAVFSPDGKKVLTGSFDYTARLWEVDYRDFVTAVCARLLRDFTDEEREQAHITDQEPSCP
jgi:WD40 repeat protein/transcriptional regulator with XRE-family HTH domain